MTLKLLYDPAIPLLGIYPKHYIYPATRTLAHPCLLLPIATDKWIVKMWYLYTLKFYSVNKSNGLHRKMDELKNVLSEVIQAQKDKLHMFSLL